MLVVGIGTIPVLAQSQTDIPYDASRPKQIQDRSAEEAEPADEIPGRGNVRGLAQMPDDLVCRLALDARQSDWERRSQFADFVARARSRGLTIDRCRVTLGLTAPAAAPVGSDRTNASELAVMPDQLICTRALDWPNPIWQPSPYTDEARRRFLTVNDCFTMQRTPSVGAPFDVDKTTNIRICQRALDARKSGWETLRNFRRYVEAAADRGLTVSRCRELLEPAADNASTGELRRLDTSIVCMMSFEPKAAGSSRWQMKSLSDSYVAELGRRYTTEARCRELLGI